MAGNRELMDDAQLLVIWVNEHLSRVPENAHLRFRLNSGYGGNCAQLVISKDGGQTFTDYPPRMGFFSVEDQRLFLSGMMRGMMLAHRAFMEL
jgi:hypothetical protein